MNSLVDIALLVFLLGSSAVCSGSQTSSYSNSEFNDNRQYGGNGLDKILKAVLAHESTSHGQHSGSISHSNGNNIEIKRQGYGYSQDSGYSKHNPNQHLGTSSFSNGYQYMPASGEHYSNTGSQNTSPKFSSQYFGNNNGHQGYQYPSPITSGNHPQINSGQSSNSGYQYDPPKQNYYENYLPPTNYNNGYNYDKPEHQSSSTYSNFKGQPYLPAPSTSNTGYHYQQHSNSNEGFSGPISTGYQYESPKQSGYSYDKPQQLVQPESSFKGKSYLPLHPSSFPTHQNDGSSLGYSYDKPATPFKGNPYLPLPPVSGGW